MAARIRRTRILQPQESPEDAAYIYGHVQSAGMVVYLAEAAGLDTNVMQHASLLATNTAGNKAAVTAAARRVVPWSLVCKGLWPKPCQPNEDVV
jgi:hypothetical protein